MGSIAALAAVLAALVFWAPRAAGAADTGSSASCALPCDHPAQAAVAKAPTSPPHPAVPQSCIQSAGCGGGASSGLTIGAVLLVLGGAALGFEPPRPRLLRRRMRGRDDPPAGVPSLLLRPPQFV